MGQRCRGYYLRVQGCNEMQRCLRLKFTDYLVHNGLLLLEFLQNSPIFLLRPELLIKVILPHSINLILKNASTIQNPTSPGLW